MLCFKKVWVVGPYRVLTETAFWTASEAETAFWFHDALFSLSFPYSTLVFSLFETFCLFLTTRLVLRSYSCTFQIENWSDLVIFATFPAVLSLIYHCSISEIICLKHMFSVGVYLSIFPSWKLFEFGHFWLIWTVFSLKFTAIVSEIIWSLLFLSWMLAWLRWCGLGS